MKHILTLEGYYSYDDFKKGKWGTPAEIEEDLRTAVIKLFTYAGISDNLDDVEYEDQSNDKGIKWQITIKHAEGKDILHAYMHTNWSRIRYSTIILKEICNSFRSVFGIYEIF